jgi:hypothetical protein
MYSAISLVKGQFVFGHVARVSDRLHADPSARPDVEVRNAAVVDLVPEPGVRRKLKRAAEKVANDVAVAD